MSSINYNLDFYVRKSSAFVAFCVLSSQETLKNDTMYHFSTPPQFHNTQQKNHITRLGRFIYLVIRTETKCLDVVS